VRCNLLHFSCNVWEKVFAKMDNKSVLVNGSMCLILYVNVVVLIIKIQNTIQNKLPATFVSFEVFGYSTILTLNLPCRSVDLPTHMALNLPQFDFILEVESLGIESSAL
jgi:hypothetical protein